MTIRQRLVADPFMGTLKRRAEMGFEWYKSVTDLLKHDLKQLQLAAKTNLDLWFAASSYEIQIESDETENADDIRKMQPFRLLLTTHFSQVKLVVNDPLSWITLEVAKRSPVYEGVLERGAAEIVLTPKGITKDPLHWVECDWLSSGGLDFPQTKEALADKLWEILFHPQMRDQVIAFRRSLGYYPRRAQA